MYRRYYSYNDMPTVAPPKQPSKTEDAIIQKTPKKENSNPLFENGKFLGKFETDDIILLVIIFILLMDDCDDKLLLLALAFVFFNS